MSEYRCIGSFSKQVKRVNDANNSGADVYSVTKYDGFVRSLDYFKKQVFSRDLSAYKIVKKGEFAYSTIHLDEGALGLLADEEALISPMYTTFEVDGSVDRSYLSYLLKSPDLINQYGLIGQGSVNRRKSVPFSSLAEIEVYIPPLPEQKKIAEILSGIDKAAEKLSAQIGRRQMLLTSLRQSIFDKQDARCYSISEIVADRVIGTTRRGMGSGESIPLVKMGDITKGEIKFGNNEQIEYNDDLENLLLKKGDILFNTRNTPALVGKTAICNSETKCCYDNNLMRIRVSPGVNPWYLNHLMNSPQFLRALSRISSGTTSVAAIYWNDLRHLKIPLPSFAHQEQVVKSIEALLYSINKLKAMFSCLDDLKSAASSDLLSGRKRVSI